MLGIMAGEIMLQASVLCVILYLVARHEADYSISKVAMVVAGITLGTFMIEAFLSPKLGKFTILASLAFIAAMLMKFCWITLKKSVIVVAIYCTFYLIVSFASSAIKAKFVASMDQPTIMDRQSEDLMLIKEEMERQQRAFVASAPQPEIPDQPLTATEPEEEPESIVEDTVPEVPVDQAPSTPAPTAVAIPAPPAVQPVPAPATDVAAPVPVTTSSDWKTAVKKLKSGGVMGGSNGKMTAFVNNKLVEVGDVVSTHHEQSLYRWKVKAITREKGVTFEPLDKKAE